MVTATLTDHARDSLADLRARMDRRVHAIRDGEHPCDKCGTFTTVVGDYPPVCIPCFIDDEIRYEATVDMVKPYFPEVTEDNFHEYLEKFIELSKEG